MPTLPPTRPPIVNSLAAVDSSPQPARFTSRLIEPDVMLVAAEGELDASNARELTDHVDDAVDGRRRLIVDLRGLTFFGTAGFSALHRLNVNCARRDVAWVVLPGRLVNRVLEICDHERVLPVAAALDSALAAVSAPPTAAKPA